HELPEALGATAGERVLLDDAAPQPDDVLGAVAASDAGPALLGGPAATQVVGGVEAGGRRGGTVGGGHGGAPLARRCRWQHGPCSASHIPSLIAGKIGRSFASVKR